MTPKRNFILSVLCLLAAIGCWAKNSVAPMTPGIYIVNGKKTVIR